MDLWTECKLSDCKYPAEFPAGQADASINAHDTAQRVNAAISTEHSIESNGGITDELDRKRKEAFID
jgi:hypothetical protein